MSCSLLPIFESADAFARSFSSPLQRAPGGARGPSYVARYARARRAWPDGHGSSYPDCGFYITNVQACMYGSVRTWLGFALVATIVPYYEGIESYRYMYM